MARVREEEYREALEVWLENNKGKDINNIKERDVVFLKDKVINLGSRIKTIKKILRGQINCLFSDEQREYWVVNKGLELEYKYSEDEYREALEVWLEENPDKDINDIKRSDVVVINNGKLIQIGEKIDRLKSILKGNIKGGLSDSKYDYWVGEKGLDYENRYSEEDYRKALEKYLVDNPNKDINDVKSKEVIILENGKKINLGRRIDRIRLKYANNDDIKPDIFDYWINKQGLNIVRNRKAEIILDLEKKAKKDYCLTKLNNRRVKKSEFDIKNITSEFDVNMDILDMFLDEKKCNKSTNLKKRETVKYNGRSLRSFCLNNGYNYDVVLRMINTCKKDKFNNFDELVNYVLYIYNYNGQNEPFIWTYEKDGYLVKHILLYLGLDSDSIIKDMRDYMITFEEAIRHDIFRTGNERDENVWVEELYNYLIEEVSVNKNMENSNEIIVSTFMFLVREYHLTKEEYSLLWNVFSKYVKVMREYEIVDVGLETNNDKRLEKINKYNLDEYDIEESFFIPLKFDKGVLLGRQSELYKRRELLRRYIIDWDYYSEEEKERVKLQNSFTLEEINYINKTRSNINCLIKKL